MLQGHYFLSFFSTLDHIKIQQRCWRQWWGRLDKVRRLLQVPYTATAWLVCPSGPSLITTITIFTAKITTERERRMSCEEVTFLGGEEGERGKWLLAYLAKEMTDGGHCADGGRAGDRDQIRFCFSQERRAERGKKRVRLWRWRQKSSLKSLIRIIPRSSSDFCRWAAFSDSLPSKTTKKSRFE